METGSLNAEKFERFKSANDYHRRRRRHHHHHHHHYHHHHVSFPLSLSSQEVSFSSFCLDAGCAKELPVIFLLSPKRWESNTFLTHVLPKCVNTIRDVNTTYLTQLLVMLTTIFKPLFLLNSQHCVLLGYANVFGRQVIRFGGSTFSIFISFTLEMEAAVFSMPVS